MAAPDPELERLLKAERLAFERYSLLTGTSVMLGSILRYPRLSMIQGWSRYGGNSSAAVRGSRTCC